MNLQQLRKEIDKVDDEIIDKLVERQRLVLKIADIKKKNGIKLFQKKRYIQILKDRENTGKKKGLPQEMIKNIWEVIHDASVKVQEEKV
jgi:chorismate mutase